MFNETSNNGSATKVASPSEYIQFNSIQCNFDNACVATISVFRYKMFLASRTLRHMASPLCSKSHKNGLRTIQQTMTFCSTESREFEVPVPWGVIAGMSELTPIQQRYSSSLVLPAQDKSGATRMAVLGSASTDWRTTLGRTKLLRHTFRRDTGLLVTTCQELVIAPKSLQVPAKCAAQYVKL